MQAEPNPKSPHADRARAYWRANLRLIGALLSVWAIVSFGLAILGVEALNRFKIGFLPLGFWVAQQGAIYVFVLLVLIYAWRMQRLDKKFGMEE
jgi:putative solute:sodium symporter small subunit